MKFFVSLIKSFFLSPFIIYVFNVMASVLDCYIPINLITVLVVGLLGIFGLFTLALYMLFIL